MSTVSIPYLTHLPPPPLPPPPSLNTPKSNLKNQHIILYYNSSFTFIYRVMRLCLDLYCKNPHVLDPLRQFIILPSNKTIR